MKPTTMLVSLSFLLFAFTTHIPLAFSERENVLDVNGNPLIGLGEGYYILPAIWGPSGGGVFPAKTGKQKIPVTVLQDYSEVVRGEPVKFDTGFRPGLVFLDEPLNITFAKKPQGASSSQWVVVSDGFPVPWVGIGGAEDHPRKEILSGKFKIQKHGFGYKLVYSPTFTAPPGLSFDIGRRDGKKGRRLILAEEGELPFEVVFVDATGADGIKSVV